MLRAFSGYDKLTPGQHASICNGAGAAGSLLSKFIPNTIWGLDCTSAFDRHDYGYWAGLTAEDKMIADLDMLANLIYLIDSADGKWAALLAPLRRRRAMKYYEAVHLKGWSAFWADTPHFSRKTASRQG